MDMWLVTEFDEIQPPKYKKGPGRPKKLKRRELDENPNKTRLRRDPTPYKCSRCQATCHNMRRCPLPPPVVPEEETEELLKNTRPDITTDTGAQAAEDEPEGFMGGSSDPSMLTQYADHVAGSVWMGEERPELKLSSHGRKVHSLGRSVLAIEGLVAGTRLSPLIACSVDTGDRGLLSSFVKRWHQETSSFHLPVGEPLHVDDAVQMQVDLLMVSAEAVRAETGQCRGPYVRLQWVRDIYECRCQAGHWTAAAHTYLLHLLGYTLFANKSATNVHVVFSEALRDLSQTGRYVWGVVVLVHMYDHLNDASIRTRGQLGSYITLLQCWIYEHFPSVAESIADPDYDEDSLCACRWIATKKTVKSIRTLAYRERLDQLRISDFGYTQTIPAPSIDSWVSYDDIHDRWMHYLDHMVAAGEASHQILEQMVMLHSPELPLRIQTHIRLVMEPAAPSTSARSNVVELRHAMEACHAITERLQSHLNLEVVTPDTSTHELIEECLRIARSVTQDQLVYVRSQHRRHTDQS
ncbi:Protein MAIN-LIKE 1 [Glycine max]|nr:Protein MAIN-LIKE 1 [Glycine max]